MRSFEVIIKSTEVYSFKSIEADNEDLAIEKALELLDEDVNKGKYHTDSEGSEEANEL